MKLNLIPNNVRKGTSMVGVAVLGGLCVLIAAGVSAFLVAGSTKALDEARQRAFAAKPDAEAAVAWAVAAQAVVDSTKGVATNIELAKAMQEHNTKYTRFYQQVGPYIPGFMRITSMNVTPGGPKSCTLNLSGVLYSNQQYVNATLALLRIPGAQAVSRNGYTPRPLIVPAITEEDQIGLPARPGQDRPVTDPYDRFNNTLASAGAATQGFEDLNNFGSDGIATRGPLATGANVTFAVTLLDDGKFVLPPGWNFDFMVPNPTPTLAGAATRPAPGAAGAVAGTTPASFSDPAQGGGGGRTAGGGEERGR